MAPVDFFEMEGGGAGHLFPGPHRPRQKLKKNQMVTQDCKFDRGRILCTGAGDDAPVPQWPQKALKSGIIILSKDLQV